MFHLQQTHFGKTKLIGHFILIITESVKFNLIISREIQDLFLSDYDNIH